MRSIKEKVETEEIEKAVDIAYDMHVTGMKMCRTGVREKDIFGAMEGMALSKGAGTSFPIILSVNGQTLHNHSHDNMLEKGKMMVADAGAESDFTMPRILHARPLSAENSAGSRRRSMR